MARKHHLDGWFYRLGCYTQESRSGIKLRDCEDYNEFERKTIAWWDNLTDEEKVKIFTEIYP